MKVHKECDRCEKEIVGYTDQLTPKIWDKSSRDPSLGARKCIAFRNILGAKGSYTCVECFNALKTNGVVAAIYGVGFEESKETVLLRLKPDPKDDTQASVVYRITQADAIKMVDWLVEHGVVKPFVSFE